MSPIVQTLKVSLALIIALLGLVALYQMLMAEVSTGHDYTNYFKWSLATGAVFLASGAALTILDKEDTLITPFDEEKKK